MSEGEGKGTDGFGESVTHGACDAQAIGDQLVYQQAEGFSQPYDGERFRQGTVYGWNLALKMVAEALGQTYEGKSYGARIVEVPCPGGHDTYGWEQGSGYHMGTYTCECGATKRCTERNSAKAHKTHRFGQACKAMEGDDA